VNGKKEAKTKGRDRGRKEEAEKRVDNRATVPVVAE